MQDDEKKPEDDPDIDDIDDIDLDDDDFEDVSWDDFDDLDVDLDMEDDGNAAPPKPAKPAGEKSFFSRHFNTIVISIAVIGGVLWFLTAMSKPPANQSQQATQNQSQQAAQNQSQQAATVEPVEPAPAAPEEPAGFMENPDNILAGLEEAEARLKQQEKARNKPPMPTPVQTQAVDEAEDMTAGISQPASDPVIESPLTPMPGTPEPAMETEAKAKAEPELRPEPKSKPEPEPEPEPAPEESIAVLNMDSDTALEMETDTPLEVSRSVNATTAQENAAAASAEIEAMNAKIQDLETFMTTASLDVNAQIATLEKKIEQLTLLVEILATKPAPVAAKPKAAQKPASKPAAPKTAQRKTPKAESRPAPKAPVAKAPPASAPKQQPVRKTAPAPQWQLRGVGAGQALLAPKGSNELTTVKVGSTLRGVGKITAIEQENGRWVVRGTQGSVIQ